ncbi:MAG TPA: hypothetical protein VNO50_12225 [Pyrinomonadaceae bacterium]|nr:hypothetical protein [Pyrinomonadaceae bacterium]
MFYRKFNFSAAVLVLALLSTVTGFAKSVTTTSFANTNGETRTEVSNQRVLHRINLAILIQDDLTSQVSNELRATADFIRSLPKGSRVMVGYITAGSLQVRQPFTADLERAARSLRIVRSSTSASPFNPYVEVVEALRSFDNVSGQNAVLLISDGLDTSRGFDIASSARTLDLDRAIKHANSRNVAVYTFYAPSVGLTGRNRIAASYGQNSLNRLADETGGRAFFQGSTGFVTFDSYFRSLTRTLNEQNSRTS